MSDSYVSKLENLLTLLKSVMQAVPEAKKLLDNLGVDPNDPFFQPTLTDKETNRVVPRSESSAKSRVDELEKIIQDEERLNQIISERIALIQQELNAKKQVSAVSDQAAPKPTGESTRSDQTRKPRTGSTAKPAVSGDVVRLGNSDLIKMATVPSTSDSSAPSMSRRMILTEDEDVGNLSRSEVAKMKLAVRAMSKKLTAANDPRGKGLLRSIQSDRSIGSTINAFEEVVTSLVQKTDDGYSPVGPSVAENMGEISKFRTALPHVLNLIKAATSGKIVKRDKISYQSEAPQDRTFMLSKSNSESGSSSPSDTLRAGAEDKAVGKSRRRSLSNAVGAFKDRVRFRLGMPIGKGTDADLLVTQDTSRGYISAASSREMLSDNVDNELLDAMHGIVQSSIEDVKSGKVSQPSQNSAIVGTRASIAIPNTLKAALVKYAPQIQATATETGARGAIGRESRALGVFGSPDAQHTLTGLFAAILAAKLQTSGAVTKKEQMNVLKSLNVRQIFTDMLAPDMGVEDVAGESTTSLAGIMHQRVKDRLAANVDEAEQSYITETNEDIKKQKYGRLKAAQSEYTNYLQLDQNPETFRAPTDSVLPMKYSMRSDQLRPDLRAEYPRGTTAADLVKSGQRTATTRNPGRLQPGHIVEIPEDPGKRYVVTSINKPDFSTPEGIADWEQKEGWSYKGLSKYTRGQVNDPKAMQISFRPYDEEADRPKGPKVPADLISNPTAKVVGVDNNPEEMIMRVAGGRFDQTERFNDMVTHVRQRAATILPYLKRIGRFGLPVPFTAPTPLHQVAENYREGYPLMDETATSLKAQDDLKENKFKKVDNVLAGLGLISSNSKYHNFFGGLQTAQKIINNGVSFTGEDGSVVNADGTINAESAQQLKNPLSSIKSFFGSMQQLEQAQYRGFPVVDYANALDPDNPNYELAEAMESASPDLQLLKKRRLLGGIRKLAKSKKFNKSDAFGQFSMLADFIRPVLEPLLGEGDSGPAIADTLVKVPETMRPSLPLLHMSGNLSDRIAAVLGKTDDLQSVRNPTPDNRSEVTIARGLRYRIAEIAKSVTGRFPSPAYNDLVVQRHKREGIVAYPADENLDVTDKLAERQYLASLSPEERVTELGNGLASTYEAGERVDLERETDRVRKLLKAPEDKLTDAQKAERAVVLQRIDAGQNMLGPDYEEQDNLDNEITYDYESNKGYSKRPDHVSFEENEDQRQSPLDELVAKFQNRWGDVKGLKQMLALAIGSPTARGQVLQHFRDMTPGLANSLRFTDFGNQGNVDKFVRDNESDPNAAMIASLMKREKGHKYINDPVISAAFSKAEQTAPAAQTVERRRKMKEMEETLAKELSPKVGRLRVLSHLHSFGFPLGGGAGDSTDADTVKTMQRIFSVLAPGAVEDFRKINANDPSQIERLNSPRGAQVLKKAREMARRLKAIYHSSSKSPDQLIAELRQQRLDPSAEFVAGSHEQNAQLLMRDKAMAYEGVQSNDAAVTAEYDFTARAEAEARENLARQQEADRERRAALDKSWQRRVDDGKKPVSRKLYNRAARMLYGMPYMERAQRIERGGDYYTDKEAQELWRNSPEYVPDSVYREKGDAGNLPNPVIDYGFSYSRARDLPQLAESIENFPELDRALQKQYGSNAAIPYESRYGSAFGGAGIQADSAAYKKAIGYEAVHPEEKPEKKLNARALKRKRMFPTEDARKRRIKEASAENQRNRYIETVASTYVEPEEDENSDKVKKIDKTLRFTEGEIAKIRSPHERIAKLVRDRVYPDMGPYTLEDTKAREERYNKLFNRLFNGNHTERTSGFIPSSEIKLATEVKTAPPTYQEGVITGITEIGIARANRKRLEREIQEERTVMARNLLKTRNAGKIKRREEAEREAVLTGRRALPAPDPDRPESEYTPTQEQLKKETTIAKGKETKRRNKRNKRAARLLSVYTDYDAGAVIPPSSLDGIPLQDFDKVTRTREQDEKRRSELEEQARVESIRRSQQALDGYMARRAQEQQAENASVRQQGKKRRSRVRTKRTVKKPSTPAASQETLQKQQEMEEQQRQAFREWENRPAYDPATYDGGALPVLRRVVPPVFTPFALLPAPDDSKEYMPSRSREEDEQVARSAAAAEQARKERRRGIASRAFSIFNDYRNGKGARPRRVFNLRDEMKIAKEAEISAGLVKSRRPMFTSGGSYSATRSEPGMFTRFASRANRWYQRVTNEGVDVGGFSLFPVPAVQGKAQAGQQVTIDDRTRRRRADAAKRFANREETDQRIEEQIQKDRMSSPVWMKRRQERERRRRRLAESDQRMARREETDRKVAEREAGPRAERQKRVAAENEQARQERQQFMFYERTARKLERSKFNQFVGYSPDEKIARREAGPRAAAEERRERQREKSREERRQFQYYARTDRKLERSKFNRFVGYSPDAKIAQRKESDRKRSEEYLKSMVDVENPEYRAVSDRIFQSMLKRDGTVDMFKHQEAVDRYVEKTGMKRTIQKSVREVKAEKAEKEKNKPLKPAQQADYDLVQAEKLEKRRKSSAERFANRGATDAKIAAREREQYFKLPAVLARIARGERVDSEGAEPMMENPALIAKRREIDQRLEERAKAKGTTVTQAMRDRAYRLLSKEANPAYAAAVAKINNWMDQKKITDPEERSYYLNRINVAKQRNIPTMVATPKSYRADRATKDYINLAQLRQYSPEEDPGAGMREASLIVDTAIQKKFYANAASLSPEELASRDERAKKIRDRLLKNKRPYNQAWRKAQKRDEIEEIMTLPEELLSDKQRSTKAGLLEKLSKGEDIYALDPSEDGSGGSGGGDGGSSTGSGESSDEGDDGKGRRGRRGRRGKSRKGDGSSGGGDTTIGSATIDRIEAARVIINGSPVNVIARTVETGHPTGGAAASATSSTSASGASGKVTSAVGASTPAPAEPSPGVSFSGRRLVKMGEFGPEYTTAAEVESTPTEAPAAPGVSAADVFSFVFGGGGGGRRGGRGSSDDGDDGGGGTGSPFGLGGEFGEGGSRTFGADRLLSVQRLKAMRNAYEQNLGSLSGASVGVSRSELVKTSQSTARDIINHEDMLKETIKSARKAGLGSEAAKVSEAFDAIQDPSKNIAELAADLLRLQSALFDLDKAAEAAGEDSKKTADEIKAAADTRSNAKRTSLQTNYAVEEQDKVAKDIERDSNRRLSNLREGLQTNITRDSLFGWTVDQSRTRRRLLKQYASEVTGGDPGELYSNGRIMAYSVDKKGKERRVDIRRATTQDLEYTQQKLSKNVNANITTADLATLQKTINEEQAAKNQSSIASKFSHFTQKAQQINYWATAAFNAPTALMDSIDQTVRPALNAEKTLITARALALRPETYANAMQAAQHQQSMFGGTLTRNIGAVTGFIPLANAYGVDINKTFNVARKLAAFDPAQGTEGAQIAIREYLSGNMSSLSRRFEISRSALSKINQGDATQMIDSLDELLNGMGITDRLIDDQAASMATKYDKMLGRLEAVQLNFSKIAVNAMSPLLEKYAGDDSWMAAKTKSDTTSAALNERVAKVGDDVITNAKNGSKTIKDLDIESATFFDDLDTLIANANDAMIQENKLIEDSTGVDVNAKLYKRTHAFTPQQKNEFMTQVKMKMMTGMNVESAIRQTMQAQTDYAGTEQFVTTRRKLGELNLTEADVQKRYNDANLAIIGKSGTKLEVKDLTVLDGDTFKFNLPNGQSVSGRFLGIDAPEKSIKESAMVKDYVKEIVADKERYKVDVIGGYGTDNAKYNRQLIRAEVTDLLTGEVFDLGNKLISMGYAQYEDFGKKATGDKANIYSAYQLVAEAASDTGKGPVNTVASRNGYGSILVPTQEAINQDYANQYGVGGNVIAGLAPWGGVGGIIGGAIGTLVGGPIGTAAGIGVGTAAGLGLGQWFNSSTYDSDTSVDKTLRQSAEQVKINKRAETKDALTEKIAKDSIQRVVKSRNEEVQKGLDNNSFTPEVAKDLMVTEEEAAGVVEALKKDPNTFEYNGVSPVVFGQMKDAFTSASNSAEAITAEYETQRASIESTVMQQVSTMDPNYQKVLNVQVDSTLKPGQKTSFLQETIDILAMQAASTSAEQKDIPGAGVISSRELTEKAMKSVDLASKFLSPENQERFAAVIRSGEILQVPTGKTVTKVDEKTGKTVEVPETRAVLPTPENTAEAIRSKDVGYFNAVDNAYAKVQVQGKSTYFEEAKKASDVLLDEQTKLRETLVTAVTANAAMLSLTGLGQVSAEQVDKIRPSTIGGMGAVDMGTSGKANASVRPVYSEAQKAMSFLTGTEIDPTMSGSSEAIEQMNTTIKQHIDKLKKSANAFDQMAATTYQFDVQFKGTFRNFVDSMRAAGENASTIMSNMGQGNPRFGMDYLTQMTGIDTKQFMMQYQMIPGIVNKQPGGASTGYGYTQGPNGAMKFVTDFFKNGEFASQFNLGETMQMLNTASTANTQLVQRSMQHNWQMQDLARDNARSIEDINRNGMNSLLSIHRGYTYQMLQLASEAEVNKRMSEVTTQEAINTSLIDPETKARIDSEDKVGRARAQHLGQFNIEEYLKTDTGAQDTEMKGLYDEFYNKYQKTGLENSPEAEAYWKDVIIPARNKRKDAALARSKDESLTAEQRKDAENEYITLNDNPDLEMKAVGLVDSQTKEKLRRSVTLRASQKNLERLQTQRVGLVQTGEKLQKDLMDAKPEDRAAVALQIEQNTQALGDNADAIQVATDTINTLTAQQQDWALTFDEQWKQLSKGIGTSAKNTIQSIEELAISMETQLTEAYRKFELAKQDMVTSFTRAATEIAIQVPNALIPMYDAIAGYYAASAAADLAYNNGINVYAGGPGEGTKPEQVAGPNVAFKIKMEGAQRAADIIYPDKDDPERKKFLDGVAAGARGQYKAAAPNADPAKDGLPLGFDKITSNYNGSISLRVIVMNGDQLGLTTPYTAPDTPGGRGPVS